MNTTIRENRPISYLIFLLLFWAIPSFGQDILLENGSIKQTFKVNANDTLRYQITNRSSVSDFVLILPRWEKARLRLGNAPWRLSGMGLPMANRDFPYFQPAFRLHLAPLSSTKLMLVLQSDLAMMAPSPTTVELKPLDLFYQNDQQRLLVQGLFFGVIIVMALYNLLIYWAVRDVSFWWFVVSLVGIGAYFSFYYGFGIEYLWPSAPLWDMYCFAMIVPATNLARLFFTQTYLQTSQLLPEWNRWLKRLMLLEFGVFGMGLFSYFFQWDTLHWLVDWVGIFGVITLAVMLSAGVSAYQKGFRPARFFVLANALFVLGGILFIFREMNLLPESFLTRYAVQFGVIAQVVLFSLGLGNRLNRTQVELTEQKLEKEKIEQQKIQQAELNRLKDKLLSVISHDLRSPLVSFEAFFNLLTNHYDQLDKKEILKLTQSARNNLEQQKQLLTNLLEWAKSQWEGSSFRPEKLYVSKVVARTISVLQTTAEVKQLSIKSELEESALIFADREMIEFVCRNVLHNAIKFSNPSSTILVSVGVLKESVMFTVTDQGVGMTEALLKSLLRQESGVSTKGTANEKGTGLGLVICREFIAKNNGQLTIESMPDQGTTVKVSFQALLD
ncbi:MAG TPA: hypothetical protein DCR35_13625 [Runella sp.]|nr:hypothetical protein [Runella sp.]